MLMAKLFAHAEALAFGNMAADLTAEIAGRPGAVPR
jgi:hypothetical protein